MPMAYAFELIVAGGPTLPDANDSSNEGSEVEYSQQEPGVASRFCDFSWCKCGSCSVATLSHEEECLCCHEIPAIQHRILLEEEELNCSTANIYFPIFCCHVESLDLALLSMADIRQTRSHNQLLAGEGQVHHLFSFQYNFSTLYSKYYVHVMNHSYDLITNKLHSKADRGQW